MLFRSQILIDFLRLNNRAVKIRNEQLGKQLDGIIIRLGGKPLKEVSAGRDNEEGNPFGFPKTSMSYDFPESQIGNLFTNLLNDIL